MAERRRARARRAGADERSERITRSMDQARGGPMPEEWEYAAQLDPDFMEAYARFSNTCWMPDFERALHPKFRVLIGIVLLAYRGYHWTLVRQMQRAMSLGASRQEILEALEAGVLFGGAPLLHLGLAALKELDDVEGRA